MKTNTHKTKSAQSPEPASTAQDHTRLLNAIRDYGHACVDRDLNEDGSDRAQGLFERIQFHLSAAPAPEAPSIPPQKDGLARLAQFGMWCLDQHRDGMGDVDGCSIQDKAVELGILVERTVTEPCGEVCACAEIGFPTECFFKAEDARIALAVTYDLIASQ